VSREPERERSEGQRESTHASLPRWRRGQLEIFAVWPKGQEAQRKGEPEEPVPEEPVERRDPSE
jgi:hypothetical protein